MKKVHGAMTAKEFDTLDDRSTFYVVWESIPEITKTRKAKLHIYNKGIFWTDAKRAFTNYFHAYAYALKRHKAVKNTFML